MKKPLGIDFGTSNTCASTLGAACEAVTIKFSDGNTLLPTVVFFGPNNEIIIGQEAKNMRAAYPEDVVCEVKRQAGKTDPDGRPAIRHVTGDGTSWTNEGVAGLVIAKVKKDSEAQVGSEIDSVLITVPACFDQAQREFIINAGKMAGFKHVAVMDEPTAAAYAYGLSKAPGKYVVTDLGGGTFDVTAVMVDAQGNVKALATGGRAELGGIDFDLVVIARATKEMEAAGVDKTMLEDPAIRQDIKGRAESLKHTLSVRSEAQFNMFVDGKRVSFTYTREEFERDTKPLMDQVIAITDETLKKASLTPKDITDTILVGGATRMPMVAARLTELMGKAPKKDADPDLIVARGAALTQAKMLQESGETLLSDKGERLRTLPGGKILNCAAHSLGCKAFDITGTHEEFAAIIHRNAVLPAKNVATFAMKQHGQTAVMVSIYQGEPGMPLSECRHIDDVALSGLPVKDPPGPRIEVEYGVTAGGLCDVFVKDTVSGKSAKAQLSNIMGMKEQDVQEGEKAIRQAKIQ
ncbi:MAG: Hsp70 family protein [bacterium]